MTVNYKIVQNESALVEFIEWLPNLQNDECYYLALFSRKKYLPKTSMADIDANKQIAQFVSSKQGMLSRIRQLECEIGAYRTNKNEPIPEEKLVLYINPNPRSHIRAAKAVLKTMADHLTKEKYDGYRVDRDVLSCLQTSCGNKVYIDFDFDGVDFGSTLEKIIQYVNHDCLTIIKTRGGFHVLVKLSAIADQFKKTWYQNISKLPGADIRGDNLIPVPGCIQGGFVPYFMFGK